MSTEISQQKEAKDNKMTKWIFILALLQIMGIAAVAYLQLNAETNLTGHNSDSGYVSTFVESDAITVNLKQDNRGSHLLYTRLKLRADNEETFNFLTNHADEVHNQLIITLSGRDASKLMTAEGKKELSNTIRDELGMAFAADPKEKDHQKLKNHIVLSIGKVIFKDFIVQ